MSFFTTDPMTTSISEGRIKPKPIRYHGVPEILTVDLDLMASSLQRNLEKVLLCDHRVLKLYDYGSMDAIIQHITSDITAMVDYAIGCTYNHLRGILQWNCSTALPERMQTECPVPKEMEFPAFICSTLCSIGPCRIMKGPRPRNTIFLYASAATYMENYGRKAMPDFDDINCVMKYWRLMRVLKEIGVATSRFPCACFQDQKKFWNESNNEWWGSYFTMIKPELERQAWNYYGYVDESYYENEDVARIALVTCDDGVTPFQQFGLMKPSGDECYFQSELGRCINISELFNLLHYRIML